MVIEWQASSLKGYDVSLPEIREDAFDRAFLLGRRF